MNGNYYNNEVHCALDEKDNMAGNGLSNEVPACDQFINSDDG